MLDRIEILIEMSLMLDRPTPIFQAIREMPGIARRPRTRHNLRLGSNRPIGHMLVRRKPEEQVFKFSIY